MTRQRPPAPDAQEAEAARTQHTEAPTQPADTSAPSMAAADTEWADQTRDAHPVTQRDFDLYWAGWHAGHASGIAATAAMSTRPTQDDIDDHNAALAGRVTAKQEAQARHGPQWAAIVTGSHPEAA